MQLQSEVQDLEGGYDGWSTLYTIPTLSWKESIPSIR